MQLKSNVLAEQMARLKLAASPASRCFLVALFFFGFSSSYFGDLRSKTDPQYAANADVENHPPKSRAKLPPVSLLSARNVSKVFLYQVDESSDAPLLYAIKDDDLFLKRQWTPRFR